MDDRNEQIESKVIESNKELLENKENSTEKKEEISAVVVKEKDDKEINSEDEVIKKYKSEKKLKENKYKKKKSRTAILITVFVILLLVIAFGLTGFAILNSNNNKILNGITIRNIQVAGLTAEEATKIIEEQFQYEKTKEVVLNVNGEKYYMTPEQIELKYNVEKAVEKAYSIGRDGSIIQNNFEILKTFIDEQNIEVEFTYNEELLRNIIQSINVKLPDAMSDNTYCIEDDELIITRGTGGVVIDEEKAQNTILSCIISLNKEEIILETRYVECPDIEIEKIYSEVHSEPQNATYTTDPFQIIPHKDGIDFNIEEAKALLSEEKSEYVIKLNLIEPEIKTNEIGEEAFPDLLGSYTTKFDETNYSRAKNVKLALEKLNGVVVMPGEVFSYNKTLGKRTVEAGFDYAAGYSGGKVVPMLGGGICQVSSTLYDAVVYANLNIVERHNHMFQTQYIGAGRDATVVYGSLDFKFENNREYPIMIKTKSNSGVADVKIFGIKEAIEYEIDIVPTVLSYTAYSVVYENDSSMEAGREKVSQSGMKGCKTITYKIKKLNGQEVEREVLSTDTYKPMNKIIRRGTAGTQVSTPTEQIPTQEQPNVTTPEPEVPVISTPETPVEPEISAPEPETPATTPEQETSVEPEQPIEPEKTET